MKEGEPPRKEKFSPESPITQALVEQWETLCIQNGMLQKCWEDAVTQALVAAGKLTLTVGRAAGGRFCWHLWWAPWAQEDSVPSVPMPVLDQHGTGSRVVLQAVPSPKKNWHNALQQC